MDAHGLKEGLGGNLSHDEITVIRGALDLTHKTAADCMTPWDKVNAVGILFGALYCPVLVLLLLQQL